MSLQTTRNLLAQLSRAIGRESAQAEFRWMTQHPPPGIPPSTDNLEQMLARRIAGEPLQYILGSQPFGALNLAVRSPVLIPRPETEDWTIRLAESLMPSVSLSRPLNVLDLCTGTGCIPLLLCHLWPPGSVHATGVDISRTAIKLARHNAALCGISTHRNGQRDGEGDMRPPSSIQTRLSGLKQRGSEMNTFTATLADLMHPHFIARARLQPPYDLITSNPPYIPKAEYDALPASVREHEDARALLGDPPDDVTEACASSSDLPAPDRTKGLTFYRRIATLIQEFRLLRPHGTLALEVGHAQAADVADILQHQARMHNIDIWKDPWGKERVVVARNAL